MVFETITCRMTRSDPQIRWGFVLRGGQQITIARVDHEGLADKAGLKEGDTVEHINERPVVSIGDAEREVNTPATQLSLKLQRFVAHPPSLPWSLTETPDNKLQLNNGFGTSNISNANTTTASAISKSAWENPSYKAGSTAPFTKSHQETSVASPLSEKENLPSLRHSPRTVHPVQCYSTATQDNRVYGSPSNYSTTTKESRNETKTSMASSTGNAISAAPIALPPPTFAPGNYNYEHRETTKSESKSATGPGVSPADNYNVSSTSSYSTGNPPPGFQPMQPLAFPAMTPMNINAPGTQYYEHHETTKNESKSATGPGTSPADNYNVSSSSNYTIGNPPANMNFNPPPWVSGGLTQGSATGAPFSSQPAVGTGGFGSTGASGMGATSGGFGSGVGSGVGSGAGGFGSTGTTFAAGAGAGAPKRTQFASDTKFNTGAGRGSQVPLNECTFIQTGGAGAPSPFQKAGSISPGVRQQYQSPTQRTRSQLSPNASIHHLQYNSPMNLYSTASAAEQYSQQTGQPLNVPSGGAAYLSSATRQAIAEEEGARFARGTSPSCSPCFKRISNAVGTPVN